MKESKLQMRTTMNKPELRFLVMLLLPLTLWAGEKPSSDPFAESPAPPIEIMQVPVNDSEDRVVVTACLITLNEDDLDALLQLFPESKKSVSGLQFYGFPDTVEPASPHQSPKSLSQVLHIDAQSFLEKLGSLKSAKILHTPHLHGRLGKTVTFSEGSELTFPTEWEADPENPENLVHVDFETRHLGLEFSFITEHQKDEAYTLDYSFSHTELAGFLHVQTGKAYQGDWKDRDALRNYYPVFESRSQNSSVILSFGETMILGGMIVEKSSKGKDPDAKTEITRTLMLQTISLEKYDGPHTASKPKD
jgi:hypothetical protein